MHYFIINKLFTKHQTLILAFSLLANPILASNPQYYNSELEDFRNAWTAEIRTQHVGNQQNNNAYIDKLEEQRFNSPPSNYNITELYYTDADINDYIETSLRNELDGIKYAPECKYLLMSSNDQETIFSQEDQKPYYVAITPAIDTIGPNNIEKVGALNLSSFQLDHFLNRNVQKKTKIEKELKKVISKLEKDYSLNTVNKLLSKLQLITVKEEVERIKNGWLQHPLEQVLEELRILSARERKDVFDELMPTLQRQEEAYARILFPFNRSQAHWLVAEVSLYKLMHAYTLTILAHDPLGGGEIEDTYFNILKASITDRLRALDPEMQALSIELKKSPFHTRQHDSYSCGVIMVEDLIQRIKGNPLNSVYPDGALELRSQHIERMRSVIHSNSFIPRNQLKIDKIKSFQAKGSSIKDKSQNDIITQSINLKNHIDSNYKSSEENISLDLQKFKKRKKSLSPLITYAENITLNSEGDNNQCSVKEACQPFIDYLAVLPAEILINICEELDKKELLNLKLSNSEMREFLKYVYPNLYVTNYGMVLLPSNTSYIRELNLSMSHEKIRRLGYATCTPVSADIFKNYYRYFELPNLISFNVAYGNFSSRWRPNDLDLILKWRSKWPPAGVYFLGETLKCSTKLQELILSHCDLWEADFKYLNLSILPLFVNLKTLDLEGNIIDEKSAPYVGYSFNFLTQLESLSLTVDCKASIDHLSTLGAMTSLKVLKADLGEEDNGPLYEFISNLTRLTSLHILVDREQPLSFATGYVSLCNMLLTLTQLQKLHLSASISTVIVQLSIPEFRFPSSLTDLNLSLYNANPKFLSSLVGRLTCLKELQVLELSHRERYPLNNLLPNLQKYNTKLTELTLDSYDPYSSPYIQLDPLNMPNVSTLRLRKGLNSNSLRDYLPFLSSMTNLSTLDLSRSYDLTRTDAKQIMEVIKNCKLLKYLILSSITYNLDDENITNQEILTDTINKKRKHSELGNWISIWSGIKSFLPKNVKISYKY